jgi:hypothetical protein
MIDAFAMRDNDELSWRCCTLVRDRNAPNQDPMLTRSPGLLLTLLGGDMANSDDELEGRAATPPITYEFQSELSDDASPPPPMIVSDVLVEVEPPAVPEPTEPIDSPAFNADDQASDGEYLEDRPDSVEELDTSWHDSQKGKTTQIEVVIPPMPLDECAQYQYMEVSDDEPGTWLGAGGLLRWDGDDEVSRFSWEARSFFSPASICGLYSKSQTPSGVVVT